MLCIPGSFFGSMDTWSWLARFCVQSARECVHKALVLVKFWFICLKWLRLTIPLDVFHFLSHCLSSTCALIFMLDGCGGGGVDNDMFLLCMQNKEKFHFGDFLFYVFRNIYDEISSDDILMLMGLFAMLHSLGLSSVRLMLLNWHNESS